MILERLYKKLFNNGHDDLRPGPPALRRSSHRYSSMAAQWLRLIPLASGIARLRPRPALCQWARFLQSRQGPLARPLLCFQPERAILITHKPQDPAQATPSDCSDSDERAASRYASLISPVAQRGAGTCHTVHCAAMCATRVAIDLFGEHLYH